ncbi:putative oxysterol-binding protein [Erysiphe necator]|uniref:Putative oxysterol-binding protein n=1 Tax=Uncinula necator TaxID=52586 RepID=A0A0B1P4J6_UNCNE|nr:putative oxysterol-binding protein [Erysiphe necator]
MVSLPSLRQTSLTSRKLSVDDSNFDGADDETTVMEPDQGNVLTHIISQLRPGADLSRVVLPTFILEPRSMLERITNFMAHPELLLPLPQIEDPIQRFISVVRFYMSGWHIKPPGVKKPLNPILGETFSCYWQFSDNTKGYYISEQTSHHPPKSSYFYMIPEHYIRIDGCLKPRSKFLGNSAASLMEGIAVLRFLNRGGSFKKESYIVTQPNMYARGIIFGKLKFELGDHSFVRCPEHGLSADIEFKTKGYFGGAYNNIGGSIKNDRTGEILYELSGSWSGEMKIKDSKTGKKEVLFNATKAKHTPPLVRPIEEQGERESNRLWLKTAQAIRERNHELATYEKSKIEDMQRDEAAKRIEDGVKWHPHLFRPVQAEPGGSEEGLEDLDWILNTNIDGPTPQSQVDQILAVAPILPGQKKNHTTSALQQINQLGTCSPPMINSFTKENSLPSLINIKSGDTNEHQAFNGSQTHKDALVNFQGNKLETRQEPLLGFHREMTKGLEIRQDSSLREADTDTSSLDEFVDAHT